MIDTATALDDAFDRLAVLDFEIPNRFVNHGPMACEALAALGLDGRIGSWAHSMLARVGPDARPITAEMNRRFGWEAALGDYRRLPEWMGFFDERIGVDGWPSVVADWVPRLMPGLVGALFHGVIRTAHAVRAISIVETPSRRAELARALAHWAIWYQPGQPLAEVVAAVDDVRAAVTEAASDGARCYLTSPTIFNLHGVTGAMAVELLSGHISAGAGAAALGQLRAEHASLYGNMVRTRGDDALPLWAAPVEALAAASGDAHQVKLVEACKRGFLASGDPAFVQAAVEVTGALSAG
jgi:hypothetical protein